VTIAIVKNDRAWNFRDLFTLPVIGSATHKMPFYLPAITWRLLENVAVKRPFFSYDPIFTLSIEIQSRT
jgi:hypothetical protein